MLTSPSWQLFNGSIVGQLEISNFIDKMFWNVVQISNHSQCLTYCPVSSFDMVAAEMKTFWWEIISIRSKIYVEPSFNYQQARVCYFKRCVCLAYLFSITTSPIKQHFIISWPGGFFLAVSISRKRQKPHNLKLNHSFLDVQWVVMLLQQL